MIIQDFPGERWGRQPILFGNFPQKLYQIEKDGPTVRP